MYQLFCKNELKLPTQNSHLYTSASWQFISISMQANVTKQQPAKITVSQYISHDLQKASTLNCVWWGSAAKLQLAGLP